MNDAQIFAIARDIVMSVVAVLVFYWGRDRKLTEDIQRGQLRALREQVEKLSREVREHQQATFVRFDQANEKLSEFSSRFQVLVGRVDRMPDELRTRFVTKEVWDLSERRRHPRGQD